MAVAAEEQVGAGEEANEKVEGRALLGVAHHVEQDYHLHDAADLVGLLSIHHLGHGQSVVEEQADHEYVDERYEEG